MLFAPAGALYVMMRHNKPRTLFQFSLIQCMHLKQLMQQTNATKIPFVGAYPCHQMSMLFNEKLWTWSNSNNLEVCEWVAKCFSSLRKGRIRGKLEDPHSPLGIRKPQLQVHILTGTRSQEAFSTPSPPPQKQQLTESGREVWLLKCFGTLAAAAWQRQASTSRPWLTSRYNWALMWQDYRYWWHDGSLQALMSDWQQPFGGFD